MPPVPAPADAGSSSQAAESSSAPATASTSGERQQHHGAEDAYSDSEDDDDDDDEQNWDDYEEADEELVKLPTKALFSDDVLEHPEAALVHAKEKHGVDVLEFIAVNSRFLSHL